MIKLRRMNIDGTGGYSDLLVVASEVKVMFGSHGGQVINKKDILLLATGALACYLLLSLAAHYLAPPCGFDGQPDAHWQAEFNKLEEKYKGATR